MGRTSSPSSSSQSPPSTFDHNASSGFHSIRDRLRFKRNHNPDRGGDTSKASTDRARLRSHHGGVGRPPPRRSFHLWPVKGKSALYLAILSAVFLFAAASLLLQSSVTSVFRQGGDGGRVFNGGLKYGTALRFVPGRIARRVADGNGLDRRRLDPPLVADRKPGLAVVSVVW